MEWMTFPSLFFWGQGGPADMGILKWKRMGWRLFGGFVCDRYHGFWDLENRFWRVLLCGFLSITATL